MGNFCWRYWRFLESKPPQPLGSLSSVGHICFLFFFNFIFFVGMTIWRYGKGLQTLSVPDGWLSTGLQLYPGEFFFFFRCDIRFFDVDTLDISKILSPNLMKHHPYTDESSWILTQRIRRGHSPYWGSRPQTGIYSVY